jgi:hypothetical protein
MDMVTAKLIDERTLRITHHPRSELYRRYNNGVEAVVLSKVKLFIVILG